MLGLPPPRAPLSGLATYGPRETPWNTRELRLVDPDGYALVSSEGPVDSDASFDDVMAPAERDA